MNAYFFYGTLRDPEIAREVLGRPLSGCSPRRCTLPGYKRVYVADATYPAIIADDASNVDGIAVFRISPIEAARLSRYEGPGYEMTELGVRFEDDETANVQVFLPKPALRLSDRPWDINDWRRQEKRRFLAGLRRNILV